MEEESRLWHPFLLASIPSCTPSKFFFITHLVITKALNFHNTRGTLAMNCSGNLVLATAMLVSSFVLLLSLSRRRVPPPAEDISQRHQVEAPRSCLLSSDGRKGERKKKRVKFADEVKEDCSAIPSAEESKKLERSCKVEEQEIVGMQSNGVASATECSC